MSLHIDNMYLAVISSRLKQFKKVKDNLYKFRCPECGDSKRSSNKTRGYIFAKNNDLYFKCHNCGNGRTFSNFLKFLDPNIHKKYVLERFSQGENKHSNYVKPKIDSFSDSKPKFASKSIKIPSIAELPEKHFCRQYIEKIRFVPRQFLKVLYFANDFQAFVEQMAPKKHKSLGHNPKLIIPFYNKEKKLFAFQARALLGEEPKYITIKLDDKEPKIWGLDQIKSSEYIYITEGPLDIMSLAPINGVACAGMDASIPWNPKQCIWIFDNEKRNTILVKKMEQVIDKGYNIFIWPNYCKQYGKDINEIIQTGVYGPEELREIIKKNTFRELEAKLVIEKWIK